MNFTIENASYIYSNVRKGNLSCGGGWKDEDVGGGGVLGCGQGAGRRVPSKPLVRRELLVHHTEHLVGQP